jgi:hypothetical protein
MADDEKVKKEYMRDNRKCFQAGKDCGEASLLPGSDPLQVPVKYQRLFAKTKIPGSGYKTLQEWNSLYTSHYDPNTEHKKYDRSQWSKIPRSLKKYQRGFAFGFAVGAGFAEEDCGMAGNMPSQAYGGKYSMDMDGRYGGGLHHWQRTCLLEIQAAAPRGQPTP